MCPDVASPLLYTEFDDDCVARLDRAANSLACYGKNSAFSEMLQIGLSRQCSDFLSSLRCNRSPTKRFSKMPTEAVDNYVGNFWESGRDALSAWAQDKMHKF